MTPRPKHEEPGDDALVVLEDTGVDTIGDSVPWFRRELSARGVVLDARSDLARAFALLDDFGEKARRDDLFRFASVEASVDYLYQAYGADFITKLVHRGMERGFSGFESKFRDLARRSPLPTAPGESAEERNGLWEFALAAACATFAGDVNAAEPDITMTFEGRRVGLAAKVVYSWDPNRNVDQIIEGGKQVEGSEVEVGFVVLNLVQVLPAPAILRQLGDIGVHDPCDAVGFVDAWTTAFFNRLSMASLAKRLRSREKVLSIISLIPALVPLEGAPRMVYRISCTRLSGREDVARPFEHALNTAFQGVHAFTGRGQE